MNKLCLFICIMIIKYVYSVLTSGVSFGQLSFLKMEEIGFGGFWTLCVCVCVCVCVSVSVSVSVSVCMQEGVGYIHVLVCIHVAVLHFTS